MWLHIFGLAAAELSHDSARSPLLYGGGCRQHCNTSWSWREGMPHRWNGLDYNVARGAQSRINFRRHFLRTAIVTKSPEIDRRTAVENNLRLGGSRLAQQIRQRRS